jgi:hypothetical protein
MVEASSKRTTLALKPRSFSLSALSHVENSMPTECSTSL